MNRILIVFLILPFVSNAQYKNPHKTFINVNSDEPSLLNQMSKGELQAWQDEFVNKKTKSILDYYLLLPVAFINNSEFEDFEDGLDKRKSEIKLEDLRNGYIESSMPQQLTLFKDRTNNRDIVVTRHCGSACQFYEFAFLEFNDKTKQWNFINDILPTEQEYKDFYQTLLPKYNNDLFLLHILPRNGTEIKITNGNETWKDDGEKIGSLKWTGTRFVLSK